MAERTAALTLLGFPLSTGCFRGVLEATQEDIRAGVFTMDVLLSSCVASANLQTNKIICDIACDISHMKPCSNAKEKNDSPHVDSADGKDRRPECCIFLPCRFVWRSFTGRQHRVSAFLLSCSPVWGWAEQGDTICPLQ